MSKKGGRKVQSEFMEAFLWLTSDRNARTSGATALAASTHRLWNEKRNQATWVTFAVTEIGMANIGATQLIAACIIKYKDRGVRPVTEAWWLSSARACT